MKPIRIGTRESQLALFQARQVQVMLTSNGFESELVLIKSEGDIDLKTPLYEMGVQGVFTRSLDQALLNDRIDIAVHSMKDVPTRLATGIRQAAVLKRASHKDLLVYNGDWKKVEEILGSDLNNNDSPFTIATSSIRRKAQWLNRYPHHRIEVLRGNVNTRLNKLANSNWNGAIFAAAGLERIGLRPEHSIELDWMLPAPAQGAIMVVCREDDEHVYGACMLLNDPGTEKCTRMERDFLRELLGGCSTPISALAEWNEGFMHFRGNIVSTDGKEKAEIDIMLSESECGDSAGGDAAKQILQNGGEAIAQKIRNGG